MATYAIGDLQGCFDQFRNLLDAIRYDACADEIWLTGDLLNRGPKNLDTLNLVRSMPDVKIVLGNHDLHFLAVASRVGKCARNDTLADLLAAENLAEIIHWLRCQPLIHHDESLGFTMVHAGIPHIWHLPQAQQFAREVEAVLKGSHYESFLANMYGNIPACWSDKIAGLPRLRLITNYLTRMRYCNRDGTLELTHKAKIAPQGYSAWFEFPSRMLAEHAGHKIVFGHWAALAGQTSRARFIALDTGCVWGRRLTAYCLDDGKKTSVPGYRP